MGEEGKRTPGISFASSNHEIKTGRGGIKEEGENGGGNGVVSRRLKTMTDGVFSGGAFDGCWAFGQLGSAHAGKGGERGKEGGRGMAGWALVISFGPNSKQSLFFFENPSNLVQFLYKNSK